MAPRLVLRAPKTSNDGCDASLSALFPMGSGINARPVVGPSRGGHPGTIGALTPRKVPLGFVEGINNKIRVIQRRAYGLRDEEYLRLKILTCMLPEI